MRRRHTSESGVSKTAFLFVVALTVAIAAVVAVITSQAARSTSERTVSPLSSTEMAEIEAALTTWTDAQYPSLPPSSVRVLSDGRAASIRYTGFDELPASWVEATRSAHAAAVSQVLDPVFARESGYGGGSVVEFVEEQMSPRVVRDDGLPIAWDHRVTDVEYRCTLANGDVVVWLHHWVGERRAFDVESGATQHTRSIDQTATDEYVLRKIEDGWRIVGTTSVDYGGDISPEYGPDTPHQHEYTYAPKEVKGWAPGPTPKPGASVMPTASSDGSASQ